FAPKRIAAYGEKMVAETARTLTAWTDGSRVAVADERMQLTLAIAGLTLFNAEIRGDAARVDEGLTLAMKAVQEGLTSVVQLPYNVPLPRHLRMRRAVAMLDEVVFRLIAEGRASGVDQGDVMSMLLLTRDEDGNGLTDQQVRDEVMTM